MTEAEALDLAAKAAGWWDWETLRLIGRPDTRDHIRAHAKTLMENAALKAEIERLRNAMVVMDNTVHQYADLIETQAREIERLREALIQYNDRLRSTAQIASRDGKETNWKSFRGQVQYTLAEYHELVKEARAALEGTSHE